ncbi:MAG: serine/threonine-protein kinase, partial [Myxococcota bacterium]
MSAVEGERIDEWVIDARLGTGGMGSVYRCHNASSERILAAIKVLDRPSEHEDASARFLREAEILFSLDHPNIVQVRSVSMESEPPYLEMEYVEGDSLEDRIRTGPTPIDEATSIVEQALEALVYMHERGVCHRDLKPANLLLTHDGQLKIVDFGLAVQPEYGRLTTQGFTFGTVSYAPPEWGQPEGLDPVHWDLYAVGVVFWELLHGQWAFPLSGEGTVKQQLMQIMMIKHKAPALDAGPDMPDAVRRLIAALTEPDPELRPTSAREALEWFREGAPVEPPEPDPRAFWVRPAIVLGFGAVGAASALALYAASPLSERPFVFEAAEQVVIAFSEPPAETVVPEPLLLPAESELPRAVEIRVEGRPDHIPFVVSAPDTPRVLADTKGLAVLDEIPRVPVEVTWVAGVDCTVCWEPDEDCPMWCATGVEVVQPEVTSLIVQLGVQSRTVVVDLPELAPQVE